MNFLSKKKGPSYISARVAKRDEVVFGFFSLVKDSGEEISVPYQIEIPQSVIHINKETGEKTNGALIQAELVTKTHMKGQVICTVKLESGEILHCFIEELELSKNKF